MPFSSSISDHRLDSIADEAATLFLGGKGLSTTDAVVKAASAEDGLTEHHVRRICEKTYRTVFERMHKTASGDKNVVFDPPVAAEAARRLTATKIAAARTARTPASGGIAGTDKTASAPLPKKFVPTNVFDEVTQKVAERPAAPNIADLRVAWRDLRHAVSELESQKAASDTQVQLQLIELMGVAKQAAIDATIDEIVLAAGAGLEQLRPDIPAEFVEKGASLLVAGLQRAGAKFSDEKIASGDRQVQVGHPLVGAFAKLAEALFEQRAREIGLEMVREQYLRAQGGLRDATAQ